MSFFQKYISRVLLLFDINVKERRSPKKEVAQGLNWTKESWDNVHAQINLALFLFVLTLKVYVLFHEYCKEFF